MSERLLPLYKLYDELATGHHVCPLIKFEDDVLVLLHLIGQSVSRDKTCIVER